MRSDRNEIYSERYYERERGYGYKIYLFSYSPPGAYGLPTFVIEDNDGSVA